MKPPDGQQGFAILWAISAITVTAVLMLAAITLVQGERTRASKRMLQAQAESLTLSGLHYALAQLNKDSGFGGTETESWTITITRPGLPPPATSPDYRLETNRTEDWRKISIQTQVGSVKRVRDALAVSTYEPRYPAGILATEHLSVQGIETDSYDGQQGDYRASREPAFGQLWSFGDLEIVGGASSSIAGDCSAFGRASIGNAAEIRVLGSTRSLDVRYPIPLLTPPPNAIPLKIVPGTTRTLSSGRYAVDRLSLASNTRLVCEGNVEIHANEVNLAPQTIISLEKDPLLLKLVVGGSSVEIAVPFTGVVDAPRSRVVLKGNGDFFGSLLASQAMVEPGVRLHFDRSLPRRSRGSLQRWQRTR